MKTKIAWPIFALSILMIYVLLFTLIINQQLRIDFPAFYSSSISLNNDDNPYKVLETTYFTKNKKISANLNPPITLFFVTPLTYLDYDTAVIVWITICFTFGMIAAVLSFKIAFSPTFFNKNLWKLLLLYLSLYSTMINTAIAQIGSILAFFVILGFYFFKTKRYSLAGISWGIIIAMKLFPALIIFFVARQRKFKTLFVIVITFMLLWSLPLLIYGIKTYSNYFHMLSRVMWYGASWNASVSGYIHRLLINTDNLSDGLLAIRLLYLSLFIGMVCWYLKKIYSMEEGDSLNQQFCLTIVMMLLLSPFGWMYYFTLLVLPLAITWQQSVSDAPKYYSFIWYVCLYLVNFPADYVKVVDMPGIPSKLLIYSSHFYGLLLLSYLLVTMNNTLKNVEINYQNSLIPMVMILAFGMSVVFLYIVWRFVSVYYLM
jgi:alpha-1,2-mannosyltransferase